MSTALTDTSTLTLRVRFPEPRNPLSIIDFGQQLNYVQALLLVAGMITAREQTGGGEDKHVYSPRELQRSEEFQEAVFITTQFKIHRLTYGSPIDILMVVGGSVTAALLTAHRVVALWDKACDLRAKKSLTALQVELNNQLLKEIKMAYEMRSVPGKEPLEEIVDRAGDCLMEADIIEIEEDPNL